MLGLKRFTGAHAIENDRLSVITDGVYAIVLTLLVLELQIPEHLAEKEIAPALIEAMPKFIAFLIAFNAAATGWTFTYLSYHVVRRSNYTHLILTLMALMLASLIPFAAAMMGNYPHSPWGYVPYCLIVGGLALVYAIDVLLCGRQLSHSATDSLVLRSLWLAALSVTGLAGVIMGAAFFDTNLALWVMVAGNVFCWTVLYLLIRIVSGSLSAKGEAGGKPVAERVTPSSG